MPNCLGRTKPDQTPRRRQAFGLSEQWDPASTGNVPASVTQERQGTCMPWLRDQTVERRRGAEKMKLLGSVALILVIARIGIGRARQSLNQFPESIGRNGHGIVGRWSG